MATTEIAFYRGDNRTIKLTVLDTLGAAVNITGMRIKFTAATLPTSITKDSNNGATEIYLSDPTHGKAEIYLIPGDTSSKEIGTVPFDVQLQPTGKVYTLVKGLFKLDSDVTV